MTAASVGETSVVAAGTRAAHNRTGNMMERLTRPILAQLRQGVTPEKIALTLALGLALAVFPLFGTTTALCAVAGVALRLNQPLIQLVNYVAYPLQLALIYVFVRFGEGVVGAERMPFAVREVAARFAADPLLFMREFGMTGVHGVIGWLILALPVCAALYAALLPALRRSAAVIRSRREHEPAA